MTKLIAAVESGEIDLDYMTNINASSFCRVPMNTNHHTAQWEQAEDLEAFVQARKELKWLVWSTE